MDVLDVLDGWMVEYLLFFVISDEPELKLIITLQGILKISAREKNT